MSGAVPFTDNYRDLSNADGYQFEFRCERCGNGYRSAYKRNLQRAGGAILRGVGSMLGGRGRTLARTADQMLNRRTNSPQKDAALRAAVDEIAPQFTQCRGCGDWVCEAVCWNSEVGQCVKCSPALADELAQIQAKERRKQLKERAEDADFTSGINVAQRTPTRCPACDARTAGGNFCVECGASLLTSVACPSCNAENPPTSKFCAQCGTGLN